MKKKVDNRIRTLIENGVAQRHRSFFVLVGDKGKDQVVNLHYILSKSQVRARPSVLWCYKKELELSSHKKKRMKQIKKQVQRGLLDPDKDDPFELFISATQVRASAAALPAAAAALALSSRFCADPLVLLPRDAQGPGQHVRHVRAAGLRDAHAEPARPHGGDGGGRRHRRAAAQDHVLAAPALHNDDGAAPTPPPASMHGPLTARIL
jgi:hypothetical protein